MRLRPVPCLFTVLLAGFLLGPVAGREEERETKAPSTAGEDKKKAERERERVKAWLEAVRKGQTWLGTNQNEDGSWGGYPKANIAVTSLAVLALMANGNTEARGRYSGNVREGVKHLLRHVTLRRNATSRSPAGYVHIKGDEDSRMHGQGYATQVLALAYGNGTRERRTEIRAKLELAVECIERAQDDSGGWYYQPIPSQHEGSVTVCQIQALRAAREAGIKISTDVIDRAISYMERSFDPETGGFCYALDDRGRHSYALTAAALSTLFGLGEYDRRSMIRSGLEYMKRHFDRQLSGRADWFFYGNLYAAQSMHQVAKTSWGAPYWQEWWPKTRDYLVKLQRRKGGWQTIRYASSENYGPAYFTSCSLLILSVPLELLPTFQR